jgi:conjugative relaxase-like TrwC/TraI family protein
MRGALMFTVSGMASKDAQGYYEKDSYYTQEGKGHWSGELAREQGRKGEIDSEDWKNAVWGRDQDGNELVGYEARKYTQPDGTVKVQDKEGGTDLTYSLPKGFSLIVEAYRDSDDPRLRELAEKIMAAHHNAVAQTNRYIEKNLVAARVWKKDRAELEFTGKASFGNYDHHISREQDPQTHTHSFLLNMTRTSDGKWRAIDNRPIFENQKYLGQLHMSEFAIQLKEQGVPLLDRSHGNVELAGMPDEVIEHASARSRQIKEMLPELRHLYPNASESKLKEIACLATRKKKELVTDVKEWRGDLRREFNQLGFTDKDIADRIDQAREAAREKYSRQPDVHDAIIKAADVLSYGKSVFSRQDLVLQTAQLYPTAYRVGDLEFAADKLLKDGRYLRNLSGDGKHVTTVDMEHIEADNVAMAREGVGRVRPMMDEAVVREKAQAIRINGDRGLTKSQQEAFITVLSTSDRVVIMQGYAGTGKTTLFKELNREFSDKGYAVRGMAFTGKAAGELKNASGVESSTIHSFLQHEESMNRDTVYVIDEASMVGSRQLNRLLRMAMDAGSRIILSGDRWQIPSTAAGRPFADIQDDRKIASAYLTDIVRQREGSAEHRISQAFVERNAEKIIDALEKAGAIHYEQDDLKRSENTFNEVMKDWKNTISMATTNAQVREEGDRFHAALRDCGQIGPKEVPVMIKEPVSFRSDAERHFAQNYEDGDFLQINETWHGGPKKGTLHQVTGRDESRGLLFVKAENGKRRAIDVRNHGMDMTAYRERGIMISEGEKIMFLKNSLQGSGRIGVRNGDIAFIRQISDDGRRMIVDRVIDLKKGETERIGVPLYKYNYFRYGYVGTVDKSQGATAPRAVGRDLQDFQRTYVAGTRENQELSLHFRDPDALREALSTYLQKSSSWAIENPEVNVRPDLHAEGVGSEKSMDSPGQQRQQVLELGR